MRSTFAEEARALTVGLVELKRRWTEELREAKEALGNERPDTCNITALLTALELEIALPSLVEVVKHLDKEAARSPAVSVNVEAQSPEKKL